MSNKFLVGFLGLTIGVNLLSFSSNSQASCLPEENCPCDEIVGYSYVIRSTIDSIGEYTVLLSADEIIRKSEDQYVDVLEGEQFGGSFGASFPCEGEPWAFESGESVFVLFEKDTVDAYPDCPEYRSCTHANCGSVPDNSGNDDAFEEWDECDGECVSSTAEACSTHREEALLNGTVILIPNEEQISLRGTQSEDFVPRDNLIELLDGYSACENFFPSPPPPPCNDVEDVSTLCSLNPFHFVRDLWKLIF